MLKLRQIVKTSPPCLKMMQADGFCERLRANYTVVTVRIGPEDLLYLAVTPPELYVEDGSVTSLIIDNRQQNIQNIRLDMMNQMINRILLAEDLSWTYQDQVAVSSFLRKLGFADSSLFLGQIREVRQEYARISRLIELYRENRETLVLAGRETEIIREPKALGRQEESSSEKDRSWYLHQDIYRRLDTRRVYSEVSSLYRNQIQSIDHPDRWEFAMAEQVRAKDTLLLSELREAGSQSIQTVLEYYVNPYEMEQEQEGVSTEDHVISQMAKAVLFNLLERTDISRINRFGSGGPHWLDIRNVVFQVAQDCLKRFSFFQSDHRGYSWADQWYSQKTAVINKKEISLLSEFSDQILTAYDQQTENLTEMYTEKVDISLSHVDRAVLQIETGNRGKEAGAGKEGADLRFALPLPPPKAYEEAGKPKEDRRRIKLYEGLRQLQTLRRELLQGEEAYTVQGESRKEQGGFQQSKGPIQELRLTRTTELLEQYLNSNQPGTEIFWNEEGDAAVYEGDQSFTEGDSRRLENQFLTLKQKLDLVNEHNVKMQQVLEHSGIPLKIIEKQVIPDIEKTRRESLRALLEPEQVLQADASEQSEAFAEDRRSAQAEQLLSNTEGITKYVLEQVLRYQNGDAQARTLVRPAAMEQVKADLDQSLEERIRQTDLQSSALRQDKPDRLTSIQEAEAVRRDRLILEQAAFTEGSRGESAEPAQDSTDRVTQLVLKQVLDYQNGNAAPDSAGESVMMKQAADAAIQLWQEPESGGEAIRPGILHRENQNQERIIEKTLESWREKSGSIRETAAAGSDIRRAVQMVHKVTEQSVSEEALEELASRREILKRREAAELLERTESIRRSQPSADHMKIPGQTSEEIQELIETGIKKQISTISDKVYGKLEKRLQNERIRRGR